MVLAKIEIAENRYHAEFIGALKHSRQPSR
jgi:hypothetical protein